MVRIWMKTMRMKSAFGASAAFGLVLGAAALICPAPAHAAEDDLPADQKFLRGIMEGLGFRRDGDENINYQERAPLVLPPGRTLPPPEQRGAATANNPAWPKDPDVERRKAQAAAEKGRNVSDEREREQNPTAPRSADARWQSEEKTGAHRQWLRAAGLRVRQSDHAVGARIQEQHVRQRVQRQERRIRRNSPANRHALR